jgi:hypothetical protein
MVDGKPGLPHGYLDRTEQWGFPDQLDICSEGKTEVGKALHNTAVAPDEGNGAFLAGPECGDGHQGLIPRAG